MTGGVSRTAVNDQAGARAGMAGIFAAILIISLYCFLQSISTITSSYFGLHNYGGSIMSNRTY